MTKQLTTIQIRSIPIVLKALDRLEEDIKRAPTLQMLNALATIADGLQRRWRPVKDIADRAGECQIAACVKRGEEKGKIELAAGTRGQIVGGKKGTGRGKRETGDTILAPPVSSAPTLKELGIAPKDSARDNKLVDLGEEERQRIIQALKDEGKPINPNTVLAKKRTENKQAKKQEIANAVFSSDGPFDVVVIDPPWDTQKIDREERPNQDAFDYPVMTEEQLAEFWPKEITSKLTTDVHVFCWTTQKFLPATLRLLDKWSLKYVLVMVWHKSGGFQPVGLPQYNCEFIVYARQGAPIFIDTKNFFCCFTGERREHSRKPDEFYDVIRRVTGGSRIDVFSREQREGFAQYGNEIGKFTKAA